MRLDDILEMAGEPQKVTRVAGSKVTMVDPKKPGIETTIDTAEVDIDNADPQNPIIKSKKSAGRQKPAGGIRPGQKVSIEMESSLDEAVNDPDIFKAVFLAGGPGSGKGFVYKNTVATLASGLKVVNPDNAYEFLMRKAELDISNPDEIASVQGQQLRNRAKDLADKQEELYREGRLGLVIDGTAKDAEKISQVKERLDALGYDSMMIFVNTDLQTNLEQNTRRARRLPDTFIKEMWSAVQKNIGKLQSMFGRSNFLVLDNSSDMRSTLSTRLDKTESAVRSFLASAPSKPEAVKWIESHK